LRILVHRSLLEQDGVKYRLSEAGLAYLGKAHVEDRDPKMAVFEAAQRFNAQQREALKARLLQMPPYAFEQLIRTLLEAMGYEDVEVTKASGDKGVDVIADMRFGITRFREVIQVKRHQHNIQRPVLDQLRGALPYHNARQGTIITLSDFSPGCVEHATFVGAAPISLINGDVLTDLLIEHKIGVARHQVDLFEVDEELFRNNEEAEEELEPV
jgi:restriction system protein